MPTTLPLTVSGNEVTDALRALGVQGDGRTADSSFGVWEATTNLLPNGGFETNLNSNATAYQATSGIGTVSRDNAHAKFGSWALKFSGAGSTAGPALADAAIPITPGVPYTMSAWVFSVAGGESLSIDCLWYTAGFGANTGTSTSGPVSLVAGWNRLTVTGTPPATTALVSFRIAAQTTTAYTYWVDGWQLEQKAFATPYVHTDGATATRNAASVQAPSSLLGAAQGWWAVRVRVGWPSTLSSGSPIVARWRDAGNAESYTLLYDTGTDRWTVRRRTASVAVDAVFGALTFSAGDVLTVLGKWGSGNIAVSVNGAAFVTAAASAASPGTATFAIGADPVGVNQQLNGDILWFAAGTGTLTDSDVARLHLALASQGDVGPGALAPAAALTAWWTAQNANLYLPEPASVARPTLQAFVSWSGYPVGVFTIGFSTIGGTDGFGAAPTDATFNGPYDDVSRQVRGYTFSRGRGTNPGEMQPGQGSLEIDDNAGVLNPANPAGPLYSVLSDRLHPCVIRQVYNGVTYPRFWGWARTPIYKPGTRKGRLTLQLVDMWYLTGRRWPTIAATGATTTGAAVNLVLDAIGWPTNQRIIDTGDSIPGFSADGSQSATDLLVGLVQAEGGTIWQDASGNAVYRDRVYRLNRTSLATIADVMHGLQPTGDVSDVFNRVQITRTQSGHVATAVDQIVADRVGYNDLAFSSPYFTSDAAADQRANWILSQRKSVRPPADDFTIDNRTPALLTEILARDLVDRITVTEAAGKTSGDWHVDGLTETLDADGGLTSQRQLSAASAMRPFTIGFSTIGGPDVFV